MTGFLDSIGGFISDNSGWLGPTVEGGLGLYDAYNKGNSQDNMINYLKEREQQNFDNYNTNREAYIDYMNQSVAARNANSRAAAAARNANERARIAAAAEALKIQEQGFKKQSKAIAPFVKAGKSLMPSITANRQQAEDLSGLLGAYFGTPQAQEVLTRQAVPASAIRTELPDYV